MPAHPPRDDRVVYDPALRLHAAGGEIESIEMPCWGSLTLVRELGRTSGTQTSVRDGVMTRSETHAYRYLVRSAVGGELVIPGTTAVVGGQTCRCDGLRVKLGMCRGGGKQEGHEEGQCEARAAKVFFHGSGKFCGSASKVRKIPRPAQFGAG